MSAKSGKLLGGDDLLQSHICTDRSLPKVGGKDFKPTGTWLEKKQIQTALDENKQLLEEERVEKWGSLAQADWNDRKKLAEVTKKVGKHWQTMGFERGGKLFLYPEEALYLLEMNCLDLNFDGVPLSVQQAYSLLLCSASGCSLKEYRTYSQLTKQGYRLLRYNKTSQPTSYEHRIRLDQHIAQKRVFPENDIEVEAIATSPQDSSVASQEDNDSSNTSALHSSVREKVPREIQCDNRLTQDDQSSESEGDSSRESVRDKSEKDTVDVNGQMQDFAQSVADMGKSLIKTEKSEGSKGLGLENLRQKILDMLENHFQGQITPEAMDAVSRSASKAILGHVDGERCDGEKLNRPSSETPNLGNVDQSEDKMSTSLDGTNEKVVANDSQSKHAESTSNGDSDCTQIDQVGSCVDRSTGKGDGDSEAGERTSKESGDSEAGERICKESNDSEAGVRTSKESGDTEVRTSKESGDSKAGERTSKESGDSEAGERTSKESGDAEVGERTSKKSGVSEAGERTSKESGDADVKTSKESGDADVRTSKESGDADVRTSKESGDADVRTSKESGDADVRTSKESGDADVRTSKESGDSEAGGEKISKESGDLEAGLETSEKSGDGKPGAELAKESDGTSKEIKKTEGAPQNSGDVDEERKTTSKESGDAEVEETTEKDDDLEKNEAPKESGDVEFKKIESPAKEASGESGDLVEKRSKEKGDLEKPSVEGPPEASAPSSPSQLKSSDCDVLDVSTNGSISTELIENVVEKSPPEEGGHSTPEVKNISLDEAVVTKTADAVKKTDSKDNKISTESTSPIKQGTPSVEQTSQAVIEDISEDEISGTEEREKNETSMEVSLSEDDNINKPSSETRHDEARTELNEISMEDDNTSEISSKAGQDEVHRELNEIPVEGSMSEGDNNEISSKAYQDEARSESDSEGSEIMELGDEKELDEESTPDDDIEEIEDPNTWKNVKVEKGSNEPKKRSFSDSNGWKTFKASQSSPPEKKRKEAHDEDEVNIIAVRNGKDIELIDISDEPVRDPKVPSSSKVQTKTEIEVVDLDESDSESEESLSDSSEEAKPDIKKEKVAKAPPKILSAFERARDTRRKQIMDSFPSMIDKPVMTLKVPPKHLLPPNVHPTQSSYTIQRRKMYSERPFQSQSSSFYQGRRPGNFNSRYNNYSYEQRQNHPRQLNQHHSRFPGNPQLWQGRPMIQIQNNMPNPNHLNPAASQALQMITSIVLPMFGIPPMNNPMMGQWNQNPMWPQQPQRMNLNWQNPQPWRFQHRPPWNNNRYNNRPWQDRPNRNNANLERPRLPSTPMNVVPRIEAAHPTQPVRSDLKRPKRPFLLENNAFPLIKSSRDLLTDIEDEIRWKKMRAMRDESDSDSEPEVTITPVKRSQEPSELRPLLRLDQCTSAASIMASLQVIGRANLRTHTVSGQNRFLKISFDMFPPSVPFKKSSPPKPISRLCIMGVDEPVPSPGEIALLLDEIYDDVPLMFAIVHSDDISFFHYSNVDLPKQTFSS